MMIPLRMCVLICFQLLKAGLLLGERCKLHSPQGQRPMHWLLLFAYQLIRNTNTAEGNVTGLLYLYYCISIFHQATSLKPISQFQL